MKFHPPEPFDTNRSQHILWQNIKQAFCDEEGEAYYRFPIYQPDGLMRWEIDILLVFRNKGIFLIEGKGCRIQNIESIEGQVWHMLDWYRNEDTPVAQVNDQSFALQRLLESDASIRDKLRIYHRVALPFVRRKQWQQKGFDQLSSAGAIALSEDLSPDKLQAWVNHAQQRHPQSLTDNQWDRIMKILGGIRDPMATKPAGGTVHLLTYDGAPPSRDHLCKWIPALSDPKNNGYTYLVATAALARDRAQQGFCPRHQILVHQEDDPTSVREEAQLLFHKAIRHWMTAPLMKRAEERVLLTRAMHDIARNNDTRARQLRHDVFAWRDALSLMDQEGIDLSKKPPNGFAARLVHPVLQELLCQLQSTSKRLQREHGVGRTFEANARSYLSEGYVPTPVVILEGFSWLMPLQRFLIERAQQMGAQVYIVLPYRPTQHHGFEVLSSTYQSWWKTRQQYDLSTTHTATDLTYLQQNIFSDAPQPRPSNRDDSVTIEVCTHRHQEVALCLDKIRNYLQIGYKLQEIAIVTRDGAGYTPIFLEEAELRGMRELFAIPPRLLLLTPLGRFLLLLFEVWKEGALHMNAEQMETFLSSGLLGARLQSSVDRFHAVRAQLFERCQTEDSWKNAFAQLRSMQSSLPSTLRLPATGIPVRDVQAWEDALKQIIDLCRRLFDDKNRSIGDHIKRLVDVLYSVDEYNIRQTEREMLGRIRQAMDRMVEGRSLALSTPEFGEVLNGLVQEREQEDASDNPSWHHILLVSPESVDNLQRKIVFFLGVDNASFPRAFTDPWPFVQTNTCDHQLRERYLFLAVLRSAQEKLHLSFPQVENVHHRRPSMYLAAVAELLGLDTSKPTDLVEFGTPISTLSNAEAPPGQARRESYTLSEIAHFFLCPYRYKLERISPDARNYKSVWQLRFVAQGRWLDRILSNIETSGQIIEDNEKSIRNCLWKSIQNTEANARNDFPSLRDGEWLTVQQRVYGDMRQIVKILAKNARYRIQFVPFGSIHYDLLDKDDRIVQVQLDGRHAYRQGYLFYPYFQDMLIESWLQHGRKPNTQEGQPPETRTIDSVPVFMHQYDAIQWWLNINRDWFIGHANRNTQGALEIHRNDVLSRIRVIESGQYPKNPGDHCKYCPLHSDCLGLKP